MVRLGPGIHRSAPAGAKSPLLSVAGSLPLATRRVEEPRCPAHPPGRGSAAFGLPSPAVDPDRLVRVGDLVGAAEVALRLGYRHPQSVSLLARRDPDFPEPVVRLGRGDGAAVWAWPDVAEWHTRRDQGE